MAVELYVSRRGLSFLPASASDEAEFIRLPERRALAVTVSPRVPPKLPRWYRAMVQLLVEATGRWPNREIAHKELMIKAGFFETVVLNANGDVRFAAQSTAEWDLVQWRSYIDTVLPLIIRDYAGSTQAQFRDRVDRFLGIKLNEAMGEG